MRAAALALGALALGSACGGAQHPTPTPTPQPVATPTPTPTPAVAQQPVDNGQPVNVSLQVEALTKAGGQRIISSGETLRSGDRMALRLEVDQLAYVYVAQASADGTSALIFPRSGDEQLKPGAAVRVPPVGQWFKLDKDTGQENLFVYASRAPIADPVLQARIKSDADATKAAAAAAVKPKPAKPKRSGSPAGLTVATRGLELDDSAPAPAVDKSGVSTVRFSIQHAK